MVDVIERPFGQPALVSDQAATRLDPPGFDQAQDIQPLPITVNLSAIVGGGLLAWAPLVILITLYLEFA